MLQEVIKYILLQYPKTHPLYGLAQRGYKPTGEVILDKMAENAPILNLFNALCQALNVLRFVSPKAYNSMLKDKLKAKDKEGINLHNFLSALCELAVMHSFIVASDDKSSFIYEDRLRNDNKKDVDFSITIGGILYHVEIKSGNMFKQQQEEQAAMQQSQVIVADKRVIPMDVLQKVVPEDCTLMGSLDNKIKDFLLDSSKKFKEWNEANEKNVLFICWDENLFQPASALLSEYADGENLLGHSQVTNIDYILSSNLYRVMEDWMTYSYKNPMNSFSPFFLRFQNNQLIDNGFNKEDIATTILENLLGNYFIADAEYVKTCPEIRFNFN